MGIQAPSPILGPFLLWPNDWMHQDATSYRGRFQPRELCIRWGPSPPPQTAAWINVPLGTELGLGPDDIVLDGDPAPPPQKGDGAPSPIFGPCLLWANGWMDQDGTWHGGGPWSRPHCARWGASSPPQKGRRAPSIFGRLRFTKKHKIN